MVAEFTILGRLTRDPEVKYTASGQAIGKLAVAVNSKYKEKDEVSFFNITVFGKAAENAAEYLSKGREVFVTGEIRQHTWTSDAGETTKFEFTARRVVFLGVGNAPRVSDTPF